MEEEKKMKYEEKYKKAVQQMKDLLERGKENGWLQLLAFEKDFEQIFPELKESEDWTIQDAKDGDVLVCVGKNGQAIGIIKEYVGKYGGCDRCFDTYCFVDWDGFFRTGEYMGSKDIHPATKEQCELLFAKMKEAGYKWDGQSKRILRNEK